jgi:hypothetical protein
LRTSYVDEIIRGFISFLLVYFTFSKGHYAR